MVLAKTAVGYEANISNKLDGKIAQLKSVFFGLGPRTDAPLLPVSVTRQMLRSYQSVLPGRGTALTRVSVTRQMHCFYQSVLPDRCTTDSYQSVLPVWQVRAAAASASVLDCECA